MSPEEFKPEKTGDLIGMIGMIVNVQLKKFAAGKMKRLCLLLHGESGCGKSSACSIIANELTDKFQVTHISACKLNADIVRDWTEDVALTSINNQWRVFWIEECDAINSTVEVLLLQFLDKLPERVAVLCTSNKDSKLTERFQSRFQSFEVANPKTEEVINFLIERWPQLGKKAGQIAVTSKGNVRQALNDAQAHIDYLDFMGAIC